MSKYIHFFMVKILHIDKRAISPFFGKPKKEESLQTVQFFFAGSSSAIKTRSVMAIHNIHHIDRHKENMRKQGSSNISVLWRTTLIINIHMFNHVSSTINAPNKCGFKKEMQ